MKGNEITDLSRLCIHTITTKPWSLEEATDHYEKAGVKGITVWRDALPNRNLKDARDRIRDHGLSIVSLCRGGFFPHPDVAGRRKALEDNRSALDEAAALGAPLLVLVCGAVPGQPLRVSREQIRDGIANLLPHAESCGVKLALEPLHPMYADSRSALNTLRQANDMAESFASPFVGVAVDVYHLWWDPDLEEEICRCGRKGNLFAFHVCDWKSPTEDLLLDRGLMGEGCIPLREIRNWVEAAGFYGFIEVEIFSKRYWEKNQADFLEEICEAYRKVS